MLDVVIAVEEPLVRLGLESALEGSEATHVGEVLQTPDAIEDALRRHPRAVLILDVRYRRADPELVPRVARDFPAVHVLVYVTHPAEECVLRHLLAAGGRTSLSPEAVRNLDECCLTSLRHQAHGCLPSEVAAEEVVQAVRRVAAGELVAAPWLTATSRDRLGLDANHHPAAITPRELDVMALLAEGLGNKAIARQLGIKEQTVKKHISRLMEKMGVTNRLQVGLMASRHHVKVTTAPRTTR